MKKQATTQDYIKYRDAHSGCADLKEVKYELYSTTGILMSEGVLTPTDDDRDQVVKHMYSSVVLACLDSHKKEIVKGALTTIESKTEDRTLKDDAFVLKTKALVWQVEAIDEETATVYVRGVA